MITTSMASHSSLLEGRADPDIKSTWQGHAREEVQVQDREGFK